jgi:ADP-ribosylglycohydrolase
VSIPPATPAASPTPRQRIERLRLLLAGLAAGDCIGATSEFRSLREIPDLYRRFVARGWPFRAVGEGAFGWRAGQPTDDSDMAWCIARSYLTLGRFDPADVAARFVDWMKGHPPDVGSTTRRALSRVARGEPWDEAGHAQWREDPAGAANGSLMRNGVIPAIADDLDDAFRCSLLHGIVTHYGPLPVLCCGLQTWLIDQLLAGRWPLDGDDWLGEFHRRWRAWLDDCGDPRVRKWAQNVKPSLPGAWATLMGANFGPLFDPFRADYPAHIGYVLSAVQIAVWALRWSASDAPFPTSPGLPPEVFARRGASVIGWPAMLGGDSDTWGAIAGPVLAARWRNVPAEMTGNLEVLREFDGMARPENGHGQGPT